MDRARIEDELGFWSDLSKVEFAEHIAKIARAEALEEAAKVCDKYGICSEQIRALKEKNAQNKAAIELKPSSEDLMNFSKYPKCNRRLISEGKPNPRTCAECVLGPCKAVLMEKNK